MCIRDSLYCPGASPQIGLLGDDVDRDGDGDDNMGGGGDDAQSRSDRDDGDGDDDDDDMRIMLMMLADGAISVLGLLFAYGVAVLLRRVHFCNHLCKLSRGPADF